MKRKNNKIKNILQYFKTLFVHKCWVFYYMTKCGYPVQGLLHDLSKLSYTELRYNIKYMDGSGRSPIAVAKEKAGYSRAWMHHKTNPHHYEYWTDKYDSGCYVVRAPFRYVVEQLCDIMSANRAYNPGCKTPYESIYNYFMSHQINDAIHPLNKSFLQNIFYRLYTAEKEDNLVAIDSDILNKKYLKSYYNYLKKTTNYPIEVPLKDVIKNKETQ